MLRHLIDESCTLYDSRRTVIELPGGVNDSSCHEKVDYSLNPFCTKLRNSLSAFTSASYSSFARLVVVAGGAEKLVASRLQKTALS
jgi:hypothetical protein